MANTSAIKLPIYRAIERIYDFTMDVVERLPKANPYSVIGGEMIKNLRDSLAIINLALQANEGMERLELIKALVVKMTSVKTDYRTIYNRCKRSKNLRVLTPKQYTRFLDLIMDASWQTQRWWNKNASAMTGENLFDGGKTTNERSK